MKTDVILGLQWGDEGKGKIVDVLTGRYDVIARFQGGPNAGHTLIFDNNKFVLHTIPSGIFHKKAKNVIGNGVVIDPYVFARELDKIRGGVDNLNDVLYISRKSHLITPTHRLLDAAYEAAKGKDKIGSTLKGIGPTYTDKVARNGLRAGDIARSDFKSRYDALRAHHMQIVNMLGFDFSTHTIDGLKFEAYEQAWLEAAAELNKMTLIDSEIFVNDMLAKGAKVLAEGAQGSLLDIDFGTYPFVTSSNTVSAGVCTGLGIAPQKIGEVFGIFKAYCTRVGSGPFPTELFDATGEMLRKVGGEFGSTTGRPRRCGWLDLPALRYTCMLNGTTALIMMKTDVLNDFETIKAATHYKYQGELLDYLPFDVTHDDVEPVYKTFEGWQSDLSGITSMEDLPQALKDYIKFIESYLNLPIIIVSIGPDRTQTIFR